MNLQRLALFPLLLLLWGNMEGQTVVTGVIVNMLGEGIPNVSIFLKDSISEKTLAHQLSDEKGLFRLETPANTGLYLVCSNISYEKRNVPIKLSNNGRVEGIKVVLKESTYTLKEFTITGKKSPIVVRNDTVTYDANYFTDGLETTIEDLLKKLPGIDVNPDGVVRVGNKEIDRILVEGDDLFERGYKVLSKNMPVYPIEKVQVINDYVKNQLFKGVVDSDKVALNLTLTKEAKDIWFGNVRGGIGNKWNYELVNNLMNFSKTHKTYFLVNSDNTTGRSVGELKRLSEVIGDEEITPLFQTEKPGALLSFYQLGNIYFDGTKNPLSMSGLTSLNSIINLSDKNKIRIAGLYDYQKIGQSQRTVEDITLVGSEIRTNEKRSSILRQRSTFGRIDFTSEPSKLRRFSSTTMFYYDKDRGVADLRLNGIASEEHFDQSGIKLEQLLSYFSKIGDKTILSVLGRYTHNRQPQQFKVNRFYFSHLFPGYESEGGARQLSVDNMNSLEGSISLFHKLGNGQLLMQMGDKYRHHYLETQLLLSPIEGKDFTLKDNRNQVHYSVNDCSVLVKYTWLLDALKLGTSLRAHWYSLFCQDVVLKENKRMDSFVIDPSIYVRWKMFERNALLVTYAVNSSLPEIDKLYSGCVLTGNRSLSRGVGDLGIQRNTLYSIMYTYGEFGEDLQAHVLGFLTKEHNVFSSRLAVADNTFYSQSIRVPNTTTGNVSLQVDYFIQPIRSNFKFSAGVSRINFYRAINKEGVTPFKSTNYYINGELRSAFLSLFEFHIGSRWSLSKSTSSISRKLTNNTSFLDLYFKFSRDLTLKLGTERHQFDRQLTDKAYYFSSFHLDYQLIPDKLRVGVSGSNIIGNERFVTTNIDELMTTLTEFDLKPRVVMATFEYRY
ncbi:hypothetical protein IX339_000046 [Porphyromonas levii]|uniref:TonB-dependent receptor n=1 Tax=Porphyromonas levii TaxID=28114 RepID=UPI001B8CAFE0|nr:TonB-dependent receptor [Porphyromonas levii]MBR8730616.1 hypothetical protein [Porphyromonas levii]